MAHRSKEEWKQQLVYLDDAVDPDRIAPDVEIHPGCRIRGAETSIGPGSILGAEGPVTLENCQLGRSVELKGGFFSGSVFFDGASVGANAHVRPGTILEEQSGGAHAVGLKQTLLLPFVTLGSLINFCDVLMAGGTSRKNHSEVGSSFIHFNFTPHQDKATASLIGDVPQGVFLDRDPIFLGGSGGLVGPARITYGTVTAAGTVCRSDVTEEGQLHVAAMPEPATRSYPIGMYRRMARIVNNNLRYIGNIKALKAWNAAVRSRYVRDEYDQAVLDGAQKNLDLILHERMKRLRDLAEKMSVSIDLLKQESGTESLVEGQQRFQDAWPTIEAVLTAPHDTVAPDECLGALKPVGDYIEAIQSLDEHSKTSGRAWLNGMVERCIAVSPFN